MGQPINVLLLIDTLGGGGAERVVVDIATHLDRGRFAPVVCATRKSGPLAEELRAAEVPTLVLSRNRRYDLGKFIPLLRLMKTKPVHIVHAHSLTSTIWGLPLARLAGVPVFISHRHRLARRQPGDRFPFDTAVVGGVRLAERFADAIISVSQNDRATIIAEDGLPTAKVYAIHPGRDFPSLVTDVDPGQKRRLLGLPESCPLVTTVGRLTTQKAHEFFLEAARQIVEAVPAACFLIVGDGPRRAELQDMVTSLGLQSKVIFTGVRQDVPALLQSSDVFVLSSVFESLPVVCIEAMLARMPIVATHVGGADEAVINEQTGLLVPPRDSGAIAQAVLRLLNDRDLAHRMGDRGWTHARARFSVDAVTKELETLYTQVLQSKYAPRVAPGSAVLSKP